MVIDGILVVIDEVGDQLAVHDVHHDSAAYTGWRAHSPPPLPAGKEWERK